MKTMNKIPESAPFFTGITSQTRPLPVQTETPFFILKAQQVE
jgi:hypothetical protein